MRGHPGVYSRGRGKTDRFPNNDTQSGQGWKGTLQQAVAPGGGSAWPNLGVTRGFLEEGTPETRPG
jgi:hypothetical protein